MLSDFYPINSYLHEVIYKRSIGMNRTFQAKVGGGYWIIIAVTSVLLFFLFWMHYVIGAVLTALVVIFEIEKLIHTQYVITPDNVLRIEGGRFVPTVSVEIKQIVSVHAVRSVSLSDASLSQSKLELSYTAGDKTGSVRVSPKNPDDFINYLLKRNPSIRTI